jgi:hypothetical protein
LVGEAAMTTPPAVVTGTASSALRWAGGTGACITWKTGNIFNGHRVQGRTFLVPLVDCYGNDGTLDPAAITAITNAGNALIAAPGAELSIWSKQFNKAVPPVQIAGDNSPVSSCSVKDMASQLRSRRT